MNRIMKKINKYLRWELNNKNELVLVILNSKNAPKEDRAFAKGINSFGIWAVIEEE